MKIIMTPFLNNNICNNICKTLCSVILLSCIASMASCSKGKSYSSLLNDEEKAVNWFMAGQRVISAIPSDSVFQTGKDAPYYKMDEEGNIYMQVVNPGTPGNMARKDQQIFFRYMRTNIIDMYRGYDPIPSGNANNVGNNSSSFRFDNLQIKQSQAYGYGVQLPLHYLPIDCEVNMVIKAYYGFEGEQGQCQPYYYNIKYFKAQY